MKYALSNDNKKTLSNKTKDALHQYFKLEKIKKFHAFDDQSIKNEIFHKISENELVELFLTKYNHLIKTLLFSAANKRYKADITLKEIFADAKTNDPVRKILKELCWINDNNEPTDNFLFIIANDCSLKSDQTLQP